MLYAPLLPSAGRGMKTYTVTGQLFGNTVKLERFVVLNAQLLYNKNNALTVIVLQKLKKICK